MRPDSRLTLALYKFYLLIYLLTLAY